MNETKIKEIVDALTTLDEAFTKYKDVMSSGPQSFYFDRLKEFYIQCMESSKYKVGDCLKLRKSGVPDPLPSGWVPYGHIITPGARCIVKDVEFYEGKFRYQVWFGGKDDTFCFTESSLKRLKTKHEPNG